MKSTGYDCVIQLLQTATVLWRESRRLFRPFGLTEAQFNVLHLLAQTTEGMSQRKLSDLLVVDRSDVTLLLDRMEGRRWVVRRDDPGDRRAYRVQLTGSGRSMWRKVHPSYTRAVERIMQGIPSRQVKAAIEILRMIDSQATRWRME